MRGWIVLFAAILCAAAASAAAAAPPKAGRVFRDCAGCPEMVVVPAGGGLIGADPAEQLREATPADIAPRERPRHAVVINRPFALARDLVTRADFARFVAATGRPTEPGCHVLDVAKNAWGLDPARDWRDPGFPQTERDPVVCVSWPDAKAYVAWLSSISGRAYRLPSEAEFEYAARAGASTTRYWGDGRPDACAHANVSGLERADAHRLAPDPAHFFQCRDAFVYTSPARSFPANAFGLYDMLGDVWQWTEDCYNPDHTGAPADGQARRDGDCAGHVDKGSSWVNSPHYLAAAARHKDLTDTRDTVLGFRVARDLTTPHQQDVK